MSDPSGAAVSVSLNEPVLPAFPGYRLSGAFGSVKGNMDTAHLNSFLGALIDDATSTHLRLDGANRVLELTGSGFTYDANEQLVGGTATTIWASVGASPNGYPAPGDFSIYLTTKASAEPFGVWVATDATQTAFETLLSGNNQLDGSPGHDLIRGLDGNDLLNGRSGGDTLYGGTGDDIIYANSADLREDPHLAAATYLRGEDGNDYIVGDYAFDDINGNQGADTCSGGNGDDWVVGGQGDDLVFGDNGNDIVYGNMGADTCVGGNGDDIVRGGQGDDLVYGGAGNDWLSGDKGSDTIVGGAGADAFHISQGAGVDQVLDFHPAEGDHVLLDTGQSYTVSQVGADTVIDLGGGDQMVLVGVQLSSLTGGWIVVGGTG